ncbi:MAG: MBL fold metallo-hydrolase [Bacteroidetes bacterium]|nr:MBL fold metallo-hydrolase [Bacteroidota bacterium]
MIQLERFTFNTFMVNTYVLYDETKEAVIVDAACHEPFEKQGLSDFIQDSGLKIVRHINTHCHIDHILGSLFVAEKYGIHPEFHKAGLPFLTEAKSIAQTFGYTFEGLPGHGGFLEDGDVINFGNSSLGVLYTPGHADGSVCFYCPADGFVITGDVLFRDTVGRTDLPSGDFDLLMESIRTKLFTLPEDTVVYPGHGGETTIGYEMVNNPFIR